jgi:hypothetical protein
MNKLDHNIISITSDYKNKSLKETSNLISIYDNNWLTITLEGYFNGSKNPVKYLNITKDRLEPFNFSQLYEHFFRPDLVKLKLQGKEKEYQKAIAGMTYQEALKKNPPKIVFKHIDNKKVKQSSFSYDDIKTSKDKVKLSFNIKEHYSGGIELIRICQVGKLIKTIYKGKINKQSTNLDIILKQETLDKKLKEPSNNEDYQYPVIRNIGGDVELERVK